MPRKNEATREASSSWKKAVLEVVEEQYRKRCEDAEAKLNGELQEELDVAKVRHDLNLIQLDNVYELEIGSVKAKLEEDRVLLFEAMQHDLETRICNLERDYKRGRCSEAFLNPDDSELATLSESSPSSSRNEPRPESEVSTQTPSCGGTLSRNLSLNRETKSPRSSMKMSGVKTSSSLASGKGRKSQALSASESSETLPCSPASERKRYRRSSQVESTSGEKKKPKRKNTSSNKRDGAKKKLKCEGRSPCIVYNLPQGKMADDCAKIALSLANESDGEGDGERPESLRKATAKKERKRPYKAEFDASHQLLHYEGQVYRIGNSIQVVHRDGSTVEAKIKSMKDDAYIVCSTTAGADCKLFIKQLQRGSYKIEHLAGLRLTFAKQYTSK